MGVYVRQGGGGGEAKVRVSGTDFLGLKKQTKLTCFLVSVSACVFSFNSSFGGFGGPDGVFPPLMECFLARRTLCLRHDRALLG